MTGNRFVQFAQISLGVFCSLIGDLHWMIHLLLIAIAFDMATGLMAAWQLRTLSSSVSRAGVTRKVQIILLVAACEVAGRFLHLEMSAVWTGTWGLGAGAAAYYCVHEALSITENLGRSGVPLPGFIMARLLQLSKDIEKETI